MHGGDKGTRKQDGQENRFKLAKSSTEVSDDSSEDPVRALCDGLCRKTITQTMGTLGVNTIYTYRKKRFHVTPEPGVRVPESSSRLSGWSLPPALCSCYHTFSI